MQEIQNLASVFDLILGLVMFHGQNCCYDIIDDEQSELNLLLHTVI